jgi:hypothetical protein
VRLHNKERRTPDATLMVENCIYVMGAIELIAQSLLKVKNQNVPIQVILSHCVFKLMTSIFRNVTGVLNKKL